MTAIPIRLTFFHVARQVILRDCHIFRRLWIATDAGVKRIGALAFVVIIANPARMSLLTFLTEFRSHFSSSSFFNFDPRHSFLLKGFDKPR